MGINDRAPGVRSPYENCNQRCAGFCLRKAGGNASKRGRGRHRISGQMTVEFLVVFPVVIIIALISMNALLFFSECAAFDRIAHNAVRIYAATPAYGQNLEQSRAQVQEALDQAVNKPYLATHVAVEGAGMGHTTFIATLEFTPTLFGMSLKTSFFGVSLMPLKHETAMTVDVYKPGVLL